MTESREKTEKREKYIKFMVTGSEKKNIIKYVENSIPKTSLSEFIRTAIADKIRNIEHPELMSLNTSSVNSQILEDLLRNRNKLMEIEKSILEEKEYNANLSKELRETLNLLNKYSYRELGDEKTKISNLFDVYSKLSLKRIMELTGIERKTILEIVSDKEKYIYDILKKVYRKK